MKQFMVFVGAIVVLASMVACSGVQLQKAQSVVVSIEAGAQKAIVSGCANLAAVEVNVALVEHFIPVNATTTRVEVAVAQGEVLANQLCAQVAALQGVPPVPVK